MSSRDVYLELLMIFVGSFLILIFLKSLGAQLVFMLIAFILSTFLGELFTRGVKGIANHPLLSRGRGAEAAAERLHEKRYIFLVFFAFIIGSTLLGTLFSTYIVNGVLYPSIGSVQGAILVSAIITLVLYLTMLWMFEEKLLNNTTIGLVGILVILAFLFVFFGGYTEPIIAYFASSFHLLARYIKF
jgi:hypothetical protein